MAALTNADFTAHRRGMRSDPTAHTELRTSELTKAQWKAALQAAEDNFEVGRAAMTSLMTAAAGRSLTAAMAKKLIKVWMQQKAGGE